MFFSKGFKMVDGEKVLAIWFIYEIMNKIKEKIAGNLGGHETAFKKI